MTSDQARFFKDKILPIIREAAEHRELFVGTALDRNPLRPMLRQLLTYTDHVSEDQNRLDKLQRLTKGYGLGWFLRLSSSGRGIRLHETTIIGATPDVRQAIDDFDKKVGGGPTSQESHA
jgi:hypothetical protein